MTAKLTMENPPDEDSEPYVEWWRTRAKAITDVLGVNWTLHAFDPGFTFVGEHRVRHTIPCALADRLLSLRPVSKGALDILSERTRQLARYTDENDDRYHDGVLAVRAAELACAHTPVDMSRSRGWPGEQWRLLEKHPDTRQRLVIAGALIAAEIDRIDRLLGPTSNPNCV